MTAAPQPEESPPPPLKLWFLTARDVREPPFDFAGVAHTVFAVAPDEESARALAFIDVGHKAWGDPEKTICLEFRPRVPGIIVAVC